MSSVTQKSVDPIETYYRGLADTSRSDAYKDLGFNREARRKFRRQRLAQIGPEDSLLDDAIQQAFSKVTSLDQQMINEIKEKWMAGGAPSDFVMEILKGREEDVRSGQISERDLREALLDLWHKQRVHLERAIRTESVNAYSKVQLQEWYDQGVREVERISINDPRTCELCRELAAPGRNIYLIEDLLQQDYPVTFMSHPNCRCAYRPRVNWEVFDEFERALNITSPPAEFTNATDVTVGESSAVNVPIEYEETIRNTLRDFQPGYQVEFVPDITEHPQWQADRLVVLRQLYSDREAEMMLQQDVRNLKGEIVTYKDSTGKILISGDAGDVNRIVVPTLREFASQEWEKASDTKKSWVKDRFDTKKELVTFTLEKEGIQIFGGEPFVTPQAAQSPKDYFMEAYTAYVSEPMKLLYVDEDMYMFIRENFVPREYLDQGGIK